MGTSVGLVIGASVGLVVGASVGLFVGISVGLATGASVSIGLVVGKEDFETQLSLKMTYSALHVKHFKLLQVSQLL